MKRYIIIFSILCFLSPVVLADVVIFKDGRQLECKVTGIVEDQAGIEESGKSYYVPMDKISEIIYVKKVKEDDTMKWVIAGSAVGMVILAFVLGVWGRNL
jgi:hypothetical protein